MNYQKLLNSLLKEDYAIITKLSLLHEINCIFNYELSDELVNKFYQAYLDNKNYNSAVVFVEAIKNWCIGNATEIYLIEDYDAMFKELY